MSHFVKELHGLCRAQYVYDSATYIVALLIKRTVLQYSKNDVIPQEAPHEIPDQKPPPDWPAKGAINFNQVVMQYRPGLPFVLKGLSMQIDGGEKIGVVGRYVRSFLLSRAVMYRSLCCPLGREPGNRL